MLLPTLAVAFAAFCMWLAVRIFNRGWKPGRRFYVSAIPVGWLLYLLSFGPWLWCVHPRHWDGTDPALRGYGLYEPADWFSYSGPGWIANPYDAYLRWWIDLRIWTAGD